MSPSNEVLRNKIIGKVLVLLGGNDANWRIQHNVLHHTYTNVNNMDEDIEESMNLLFNMEDLLMGYPDFEAVPHKGERTTKHLYLS